MNKETYKQLMGRYPDPFLEEVFYAGRAVKAKWRNRFMVALAVCVVLVIALILK